MLRQIGSSGHLRDALANQTRVERALAGAGLSGAIKRGELYRGVYGRDASHLECRPQAVVRAISVEDVQTTLAVARRYLVPVTFRGAGTSLCGQTLGPGIVVEARGGWERAQVRDGGSRVWCEPGISVDKVNALLRPFERQLGPDPESSKTAVIGGVVANNSGGQKSGVDADPYSTLDSVAFMLANGLTYDTANGEDRRRFQVEEARVVEGIAALRDRVRRDHDLVAQIRRKFLIKNVMGYGLRAFLDAEDPIDIVARLLPGSEGTLAFITSATLRTVPLHPHWAVGLLFFSSVREAIEGVLDQVACGASTIEFMDRGCLQCWEGKPGAPSYLLDLSADCAALLVEYRTSTSADLDALLASANDRITGYDLIARELFSCDSKVREQWFDLRSATLPLVAATRVPGTSMIIEDVAVPPAKLAEFILRLRELFALHDRKETSYVFGHLSSGNVHFIVLEDLRDSEGIARHDHFQDELADLVLGFDGSLKAEHGTGRTMAKYLEREWGKTALAIMRDTKQLLDPCNLLNPGVLLPQLTSDSRASTKGTPSIGDATMDRCFECGFCEEICPSRDLTLTPRQRIAAKRIGVEFEESGDLDKAAAVWSSLAYQGRDTCVADGLCGTVCPVGINVAHLTDHERSQPHCARTELLMDFAARHFRLVEQGLRIGVGFGAGINQLTGTNAAGWVTAAGHRLIPDLPQWSRSITGPPPRVQREVSDPQYVYFPACVHRIMGSSALGKKSVMEAVLSVADRAGLRMRVPQNVKDVCCGQIWLHKGFIRGHTTMANQIVEAFWWWSEGGRLPILCDVTSCVRSVLVDIPYEQFGERRPILTDQNLERHAQLKIMDLAEWLHDVVLPTLRPRCKKQSIVVHPTCVCTDMGLVEKITAIAAACAHDVTIPVSLGCCGAGGDRGLLYPELADAALRREASEIAGRRFDGAYSFGKTCEIALSDRTGYQYESIIYLVDEVTAEVMAAGAEC